MQETFSYKEIFNGYLQGLSELDKLEARVQAADETVFEEDSETIEQITDLLFQRLSQRLATEKTNRAKMLRNLNAGEYPFSNLIKDLRLKLIFRGLESGESLENVNQVLKNEGFRELFPKNLLEACIIYCLSKQKDLHFLESLYFSAESYVKTNEPVISGEITVNYLRSIIRENTDSIGEASNLTRAVTNRLRTDIAECDSEKEFLSLLQTDIAENISDVANLQRFYTALFLYYLTNVFIEEILRLNVAAASNSDIFCEIEALRINNGKKRNKIDTRDALETYLRKKAVSETNRGFFCRRLFSYVARSGSSYSTRELFEKTVADIFGPGRIVSSLLEKNDFYDLPINLEFVSGILYRDVAKIERDQGNNATRIRGCLLKKASFSRDAFLGLITLCSMYIRDVLPESVKNEKHKLWQDPEKRINRVLRNCHLGTLDPENHFTDALALCCLENSSSSFNVSELLFEIADGQEDVSGFEKDGIKINANQFWLANESSKSSFVLTQEFLEEMHRYISLR